MYISSYEKCVCFIIFLVIFILNCCSGFRIDNLAMSAVNNNSSKRRQNSNSMWNSDNVRTSLENSETGTYHHRLRHHRLQRAYAKRYESSHQNLDTTYSQTSSPSSTSDSYSHINHLNFKSLPSQSSDETQIPSTFRDNNFPYPYLQSPELRTRFSQEDPTRNHHRSEIIGIPQYRSLPTSLQTTTNTQTQSRIFYPVPNPNSQGENLYKSHITPQVPRLVNRSQRSSSPTHRKRTTNKKQATRCYREDISNKAYKAQIVLRVVAESMSKLRDQKYAVHFKVLQQYKNSSLPVHNYVQLTFLNASSVPSASGGRGCEILDRPAGASGRNLVRADVRTAQEYVLFLNATGAHSYSPVGAPEKLRRNQRRNRYIYEVLRKVCSPNFTPRRTDIVRLEDVSKRQQQQQRPFNHRRHNNHRVKLVCKAKGLPVPKITWRRDGVDLHGGKHVRINYKKRKSTLVIKRADANANGLTGIYECVARGVDGTEATRSIVVRSWQLEQTTTTRRPPAPPSSEIYFSKKPCDEPHLTDLCLNGGQCFMETYPLERYCECPNGYDGKRCEMKTFNQPSMYPQTAIYSCKLGLSTKYYC